MRQWKNAQDVIDESFSAVILFYYIIAQMTKISIVGQFIFLFFLIVLDIFIKTANAFVSAAIEKNNLLLKLLSSIMKRYEYIGILYSHEFE